MSPQQPLEPPGVWYGVGEGSKKAGDGGHCGEGRMGQISRVSCAVCQIHLLDASWEHILPLLSPQLLLKTQAKSSCPGASSHLPRWIWHGEGKPGLQPEHC